MSVRPGGWMLLVWAETTLENMNPRIPTKNAFRSMTAPLGVRAPNEGTADDNVENEWLRGNV